MKKLLVTLLALVSISNLAYSKSCRKELKEVKEQLRQKIFPLSGNEIVTQVRSSLGQVTLLGKNLRLSGMEIPYSVCFWGGIVDEDDDILRNDPDLVCRYFGFRKAISWSLKPINSGYPKYLAVIRERDSKPFLETRSRGNTRCSTWKGNMGFSTLTCSN